MNWLSELSRTNPAAHALGVISIVCMTGLLLGGVKVRGVGLGAAGVLLTGILAGAIGKQVDEHTIVFVKEFGLVLFVFSIGLQLGPGFFASMRGSGVVLNIFAASIVLLGALIAAGLGRALGLDPASVPGVFAGATTNTPSLGAAQNTLAGLPGVAVDRSALPALAYAVTYPIAILVMIATLVLLKAVFRLDPRRGSQQRDLEPRGIEPLARRTIVVDNPDVEGVPVEKVGGLAGGRSVISRLRHEGERKARVAGAGLALSEGDLVLAVGTEDDLDRAEELLGHVGVQDLMRAPGPIMHRRVLVTRKSVLGKTVRQLAMEELHGVVATRVTRAHLEVTAVPDLRLKFGDVVHIVGERERINQATEALGNSLKALSETHFVPMFGAAMLGTALGTLPIPIPGMPQPLRLGVAGGCLIVTMLLGRFGRIGPMIFHMPRSATVAFREFGISLFFASVGLLAGPRFFQVVLSEQGLRWMIAGVAVTAVPLLVAGTVAVAARMFDFATLSGLLAGSMTDPPALAFANNLCDSDAPMTSYSAVYPLTTLLRILTAQVLTITLCG